MSKMNLVKEYTKEIKINGISVEATIKIFWDYDAFDSPDDMGDFESEEEKQKYLKKFETGELTNAWIQVVATYQGVIGSDSLGGCHISNEQDILKTVKDHTMVDNAIDQLNIEVITLANHLKQFAS